MNCRKFLNEKSIEFADFCIAAKREDEVIERWRIYLFLKDNIVFPYVMVYYTLLGISILLRKKAWWYPILISVENATVINICNCTPLLFRYASTYGKGLYEMLFILDRWLKKDSLYDRTPLRLTHLARLFIHFCLGEVYTHGSIVLPLEMITPFSLKVYFHYFIIFSLSVYHWDHSELPKEKSDLINEITLPFLLTHL